MSFNATLKVMNSDPLTLIKSFSQDVQEITISSIKPTAEVDLYTPTFVLDYNSNYTKYNYIVVDAPFNRSYFIKDMKIDIGKKIIISCEEDYLQSWFAQIMEAEAYIVRTGHESSAAKYLPDNVVPMTVPTQVQNYPFNSTPFTTIDSQDGNYVLTAIGGQHHTLPPDPDPENGGANE